MEKRDYFVQEINQATGIISGWNVPELPVELKAFLEGPFEGIEMNTNLKKSKHPHTL